MKDANAYQGSDSQPLAEELLIGAQAIARFLGWKSTDGQGWNTRRVYHVAERRLLPVHKQDGLGLVARKSALRAHFERLDQDFRDYPPQTDRIESKDTE